MQVFNVDFYMFLGLMILGALIFYYQTKSLKRTMTFLMILYIVLFALSFKPLFIDKKDQLMFLQSFLAITIVIFIVWVIKTITDSEKVGKIIKDKKKKEKVKYTNYILLKKGALYLHFFLIIINIGIGLVTFFLGNSELVKIIMPITSFVLLLWSVLNFISNYKIDTEKVIYCNKNKCYEDKINTQLFYRFNKRIRVIATVIVVDKVNRKKEIHHFVEGYPANPVKFVSFYENYLDQILLNSTNVFLIYMIDHEIVFMKKPFNL